MDEIDTRSEETNESIPRMRLRSNMTATDENKKDEKILNKTELLFKKMKGKMLRELQRIEAMKEWERYINCNQLPYPNLPSSVHQHFISWCREAKFAKLPQLDASLTLYLPTFDAIKILVDFPIKMKSNVINCLREIMQNWKCEFTEKLDYACFLMIKEIRKYFTHVDYCRRNYIGNFDNFEIGMWALLDVPFSSNCKMNRHVIHFPNIEATVTLPVLYNCKPIVLRVMYTPFDFLSDLSSSKYPPEITLNGLKKSENLMETLDLTAVQKEKEMIRKSAKQQTLSERQLSFLKNYRSHTPSSCKFSQDGKSIHSSNNFFQQRIKFMIRHARDISNGASVHHDHFDRFRGLQHTHWDNRHGGYKSSESLVSSITTFTCTAKSSIIHRIFSFGSSMLDPFSHDEIYNEEKSGKHCEWNFSDWEIFISGDVDLEDNTSFLDLIFNFDESNMYMSLIGILLKEDTMPKKEITVPSKENSVLTNKAMKNEEENYKQLVQQMTIKTKPKEVNLRCYHSFSGVYHVDLIKHESEICRLKIGDFVQIHSGLSYKLQKENFLCDIPDISGMETNDIFSMNCEYYFEVPEQVDIIQERRKSSVSSISSTKKRHTSESITIPIVKKSTVIEFHNSKDLVKLKVPLNKNVHWFMKPQPAVWDNENKCWSVEHVCDVEHDKEHNTIEFKLGKLGPISMFTIRFHELPYKNWNLSPDEEDQELVLTLEGQHLTVQLKIVNDKICLKKIDGWSEHLFHDIIGVLMDLAELVTKLKSLGLDLFPENDTFLYVKHCTAKPLALEDHIYYTMAIFSNILAFKASSWNMAFGYKEILFQFRLNTYHKTNPFQTLMCSNFGCEVLMLEDDTDIFVDVTNKVIGHYPGPFSMFSKLFRNKIQLLPEDLPKIDAVYNIMKKTKVLTFSGSPAKSL